MYRAVSSALVAGTLLTQGSRAEWLSPPSAKNFIYIVPDGFGPASQTMARDYVSLLANGENPRAPVTYQLAADKLVIGNVRTLASNNLITDSAASATAFGCGVKSYNDAIAVDPSGQPVGSILEAAKLDGYKTGLVVTSTINHATPACYAAHTANRNSYEIIAEHEIGYSHPLGSMVDVLFGGGRCYFKPNTQSGSCRKDNKDLFGFAKEKGFRVMTDRAGFDELKNGTSAEAKLPYIGLFNDDQMMYEIDRKRKTDQEPSLLEMVQTALNSLHRATHCKEKGYFLMIEASRIDHAGHDNDPAGHLHDIIMYNDVMNYVKNWINEHPDTMMMSAADHECGGLTLNGFNPLPLKAATASAEDLVRQWNAYKGDDKLGFLRSTILPAYGLGDLSEAEARTILANNNLKSDLVRRLSSKSGVNWSTGGHTAGDIVLYGYAAGETYGKYKADMAGNWDNTQLPRYLEKVLDLDMESVTALLRANGTTWTGKRDLELEKRNAHHESHGHGHSH